MRRGLFITGTDTGVGKTFASCTLIHALRARGLRIAPMKPVAAGAIQHHGRWVSEDALALQAASGEMAPSLTRINPILLREPIAPHLAAAREGQSICLGPLLSAFDALATNHDQVVVEGVGGFVVPLNDGLDTRDLAVALGLPVVLVVGMRLGCLNHALLTAESIRHAGLSLAGWIANAIDPAMAVATENIETLALRLQAPLIGHLPFSPGQDASELKGRLDVSALLRQAH